MCVYLTQKTSHGAHGGKRKRNEKGKEKNEKLKREEKRAKHILLCSLFIFHFSFLRVLRKLCASVR